MLKVGKNRLQISPGIKIGQGVFFSAGQSVQPPAAPVAISASDVDYFDFTANWNASAGATGYYLDVSTQSDFSSYVTGYENLDVGNNTSKFVDTLDSNTTYYYRVRAYSAAGTSANSNTENNTTLAFVFDTQEGLFGISVRTLLGTSYQSNPYFETLRRASDNNEGSFRPLRDDNYILSLSSETSGGTPLSTFASSENAFLKELGDQSGNSNNATETTAANQPQALSAGALETINSQAAFTFNGTNQKLLVWNNTTAPTEFQSIGSDLTIIIRCNSGNVTAGASAFFQGNTLFELRQNVTTYKVPFSIGFTSNKFAIGLANNNSIIETFQSTATVSTSTNYYLGVTITETTLKLFINGSLDSTHTISIATGDRSVSTTNSSLSIGVRTRNGGQADSNYYDGKLNEILLFNTALSDANVISIMNESTL